MQESSESLPSIVLSIIPGRVSTEVDARLSFVTEATVTGAERSVALHQAEGVDTEQILIKIAATWEGILATARLEQRGVYLVQVGHPTGRSLELETRRLGGSSGVLQRTNQQAPAGLIHLRIFPRSQRKYQEAKRFAVASAEVAAYYPVSTAGSRIVAVRATRERPKQETP